MKYLAIISAIISGLCLAIIQIRKKFPLLGSIVSPKLHEELDKTDKRLAIISLLSFILCLVFLVQTL